MDTNHPMAPKEENRSIYRPGVTTVEVILFWTKGAVAAALTGIAVGFLSDANPVVNIFAFVFAVSALLLLCAELYVKTIRRP